MLIYSPTHILIYWPDDIWLILAPKFSASDADSLNYSDNERNGIGAGLSVTIAVIVIGVMLVGGVMLLKYKRSTPVTR